MLLLYFVQRKVSANHQLNYFINIIPEEILFDRTIALTIVLGPNCVVANTVNPQLSLKFVPQFS